MERRRFLQLGATVGVGAAVAGTPLGSALAWRREPSRSVATGRAYEPVAAFPSGVASGDPTGDGVILWTRIDPAVARSGIDVTWEVADDPGFEPGSVVDTGVVPTDPATDHTVHVDVAGLGSGVTCWYRFMVAGIASPVGRTRTLPASTVDRLTLAYFSCQRFVHGYYNAHADLAARALDPATDVDLVISLGDYVYEAGPADSVTVAGRVDPEAPTTTLDHFRRQYHLYKGDLDLQAMHAAFPLVAIFDNHDGFGDPSDPAGPGARAAFFEQLPVRRVPADPDRQYRSLALGDLCELLLLDERQYRDPEPKKVGDSPLGTSSVDQPEMVASGRTMLGADQKAWLKDGLASSSATWKIMGSQLVFSPFRSQRFTDEQAAAGDGPQRNAGRYVNLVGWDGYQAERRELVDHIHDQGVADVIVVSGDAHFWTTSEVPTDWDDPASPLVLAEFAGSSITSANAGEQKDLPGNDVVRPILADANPYSLRYIEVTTHGYGLIELSATRASVTYVTSNTISEPQPGTTTLTRFELDRGSAAIRQVQGSDFMPRPTTPESPGTTDSTDSPGTPGSPGRPEAPGTSSESSGTEPGGAAGAEPLAGQPAYTG